MSEFGGFVMLVVGSLGLIFFAILFVFFPSPSELCRSCGEPVGANANKCPHCGAVTVSGTAAR